MRANCWMGKNKLEVQNVPEPKILNGRGAIVRITSTAICGSDLHLYNGLVPTMQKGDVLGHEFMGEVVVTTHRMSLDDAPSAFQMFRDKQDDCVKVVLHP